MSASVLLASGSEIRQQLLLGAGVAFNVETSPVDEPSIMAALLQENAKPRDIADTLAEYKGRRVAIKNPDKIVISSDQVLVCEGQVYSKPDTQEQAMKQLQQLRGKGHQLLSAVMIFEDGAPVWRHIGRAQLVMREFSDAFLAEYVQKIGDDILTTVGCYKLESLGVQLFSQVQGDYFTILGLPLIEVLGFLRTRGVLPT